jgi:16S rRNA processing protein RimM
MGLRSRCAMAASDVGSYRKETLGMISEEKVLLGRITGVHGLKGEVKIIAYTGEPEDIAAYGALTGADGERLRISAIRSVKGGTVIAALHGISDRDKAEKLRGTDLYVSRTALPPPEDDDEYYHSDLIGLKAVSPDGETIGKIIAVHNFGAGDLLEIRFEGERQAQLIPFENAHIPRIDLDARQAVVLRPVYEEQSAEKT